MKLWSVKRYKYFSSSAAVKPHGHQLGKLCIFLMIHLSFLVKQSENLFSEVVRWPLRHLHELNSLSLARGLYCYLLPWYLSEHMIQFSIGDAVYPLSEFWQELKTLALLLSNSYQKLRIAWRIFSLSIIANALHYTF